MNKQDLIDKLKLVFLPVFLVLVALSVCYPLLIWLFVIKLDWLGFKDEVWQIGLPAGIAMALYIWLVRPRVGLFSLKAKQSEDTHHFVVGLVLTALLAIPAMVVCNYISKASYDLVPVTYPSKALSEHNQRYYSVGSYFVDTNSTLVYPEVHASGKNNEYLDLNIYLLAPLFDQRPAAPVRQLDHWFGSKYHKQISNRENEDKKERLFQEFFEEAKHKWQVQEFYKVKFFERVQPSDDLTNYEDALEEAGQAVSRVVLFEPSYKDFSRRTGNQFSWMFYSFGLCAFGILLLTSLLKFDYGKLAEFKNRKNGYSGLSVPAMQVPQDVAPKEAAAEEDFAADFFIPKGSHFVTSIIIDFNILYALVIALSGYGFLNLTTKALISFGGMGYYEVARGEYWRILTGMFMHGGIMHLIFNIIAIGIGGIFLEPILGRAKFATVFLITGIVGALTSLAFAHYRVSVGASGAVFGLYGTLIGLLLTKAIPRETKHFLWIFIAMYTGVNLVLGFFIPQIDNAAHLGGLLAGIVAGLAIYHLGWLQTPTEEEDS